MALGRLVRCTHKNHFNSVGSILCYFVFALFDDGGVAGAEPRFSGRPTPLFVPVALPPLLEPPRPVPSLRPAPLLRVVVFFRSTAAAAGADRFRVVPSGDPRFLDGDWFSRFRKSTAFRFLPDPPAAAAALESSNNNLFQVMRAVEDAEATIRQQVPHSLLNECPAAE